MKVVKKIKPMKKSGFTLIELLIVIAIMSILATVVFVALDPMARFEDSRNAKRYSTVEAIVSAIKLDQVDNGGAYLADIADLGDELPYQIGAGEDCDVACAEGSVTLEAECIDLSDIVDEGYLPEIPFDPSMIGADEDHTGYYMIKHLNGAITIGACSAEKGSKATIEAISVKK